MNNSIYTPAGAIVLDRVYSNIDKLLNTLEIPHDETVAKMVVDAICQDGVDICVKSWK